VPHPSAFRAEGWESKNLTKQGWPHRRWRTGSHCAASFRLLLGGLCFFLGKLFGVPMGFLREFARMLAEFVRRLVIPFAMGCGSFSVGMGGQIVQFRFWIVRALSHDVLLHRFDANQQGKAT
jgi:hypothetical protein